MCDNPILPNLYQDLEDIQRKVQNAVKKTREGRVMAFDRDDIQMVTLLREIAEILDSVLYGESEKEGR